jgi:predicted HAD superfamily Cof-like phosphohydrolase
MISAGEDMRKLHDQYGVGDWVESNASKLGELLAFRAAFLEEELGETLEAIKQSDAEEVVDGLIDLCVIAIGTLEMFDVDIAAAWHQVLRANQQKVVGVKPSRPNPLGLPDLVKPDSWVPPSHKGNHGLLPLAFDYNKFKQGAMFND